jgi:hypothetical protein
MRVGEHTRQRHLQKRFWILMIDLGEPVTIQDDVVWVPGQKLTISQSGRKKRRSLLAMLL